MGLNIGDRSDRELSAFGRLLEKELIERGKTLTEFAEGLKFSLSALSRYLRMSRPPSRRVEEIISALNLDAMRAEAVRRAAMGPGSDVREEGPIYRGFPRPSHRRSARFFGSFLMDQLGEQLSTLNWVGAPCEVNDPFSYDLKIHGKDTPGKFVLLNLMQSEHRDPHLLLRAVRAQWANEGEAKAVVYLEPFANSVRLPDSLRDPLLDPDMPPTVDAWLQRESKDFGRGRLAHGGNLFQVLAESLGRNPEVEAYLQDLSL